MLVRLVVAAGQHLGKVFEFTDHRTFLVGRSADAHLRFPDDDPYISRLHFLIEVNPPEIRLVDLGSTNGTLVNGKRLTECELVDGDTIEVGETKIAVFVTRVSGAGGAGRNEDPAATMLTYSTRNAPKTAAYQPPRNKSVKANQSESRNLLHDQHDQTPALSSLDQIGDYKLEKEIGRGAFGVVYLARKNGNSFALKLMQDRAVRDEQLTRRFLREIDVLKKLNHRSLVQFVDSGECQSGLFLVTEFVSGDNLEMLLRRIGPLKVRSAVRIVRHSLLGLSHAHSLGFVHRDIKPANIIVNTTQVKLADFGLSASFRSTMMSGCTLLGESGGSIGFMPPEQLVEFHQAQPSNDIYSMGATLYRLLSGAMPYDFPNRFSDCIRLLLQSDPVPLSARPRRLPAGLCAIVERCMIRQPSDRWSSARQLYDALEPFSQPN